MNSIRGILGFVLLALFSAGVLAAGAGTVTHLSGTLSVQRGDGSVRILSQKSEVNPGDVLTTQRDSYAQINFVDGSSITMRPNTQVKVEQFNFVQDRSGRRLVVRGFGGSEIIGWTEEMNRHRERPRLANEFIEYIMDIADDERRGFVRVQDSQLKGPRHGQVLDVRQVDLVERTVVPAGVVAVGHDPLRGIGLEAQESLVRDRDIRAFEEGHQQQHRQRQPHPTGVTLPPLYRRKCQAARAGTLGRWPTEMTKRATPSRRW